MRCYCVSSRTITLAITLMLLILTFMFTSSSICSDSRYGISFTVSQEGSKRDYWPTGGWRYSTPQEHGMSNDTLNEMMDTIEENDYPIYSVLVIKDGYAVFEEYPQEYYPASYLKLLHSVTKSFTSTLIGIAIEQDFISGVNETVLSFFPEYDIENPSSRKDSMTIEDLLTMTAGLDWPEWSFPYEFGSGNPLMEMMESPDSVQYVLDRPMSDDPGEHWAYNGGASVLLGAIVQQVSNQSTSSFAQEYLFEPLGFGPWVWDVLPGGWCNAHGGLRLATRDLAKLGFLYLNNGTWNDTQILSSDYVSNATEPIALANPLGADFGYGWHWWTRSDLGVYFAYGRHGQKIMVAPEYDLIVVFTANVPDDGYDPEFDLFRDYILRSLDITPSTIIHLILGGFVVFGIGAMVTIALIRYDRRKQL
jgi:CubicO group peptidase (beta-lactamase class C family)